MLLLLIATAVLLGNIQAFTHQDANEYIDTVLTNRFVEESEYSRLDPHRLDDIKVSLNYSSTRKGNASLSNGRLLNLSKVQRSGDCTVPFWQYSNVTFTCFLRFDLLQINYTANVSYDNMEMVFYPHVKVRDTNITIQVTSNPEEDVPTLRLLFVNRIGKMNVTADMVAIGNIAQIVGPPIRTVLENTSTQNLHHILNGRFKNALAYSIYKTPVGFAG